MKEVVELRVHGVHGTSPAAMLGVDAGDVRQVAGDNLTGIYRSKSGELPYRKLKGTGVSVEAYSWGTLTSGARGFLGWIQRALWLLLLPFALANLAYWARLELDGTTTASRLGVRLTRLAALLLTVFMMLVPAFIGIDLIAWQCYRGDSPGCAPLPGLFDFMADLSPTQRLAVGSALPLAFVAVLWFLSRQSLMRYEEVTFDADDAVNHRLILRHPTLWSGKTRTQQLQRAHLTLALVVVVAFSGVHVVSLPSGRTLLTWVSLGIAALLTLLVALWSLTILPEDVEHAGITRSPLDRKGGRLTQERLPSLLLFAMSGATILHLVGLWLLPPNLNQQVDFFGHNFWFIGVVVGLTALYVALFTGERMGRWRSRLCVLLVLVLAGGALLAHLDKLPAQPLTGQALLGIVVLFFLGLLLWHFVGCRRHGGTAWNGAGPSVLLAAAAWIALLFTTGVVTATANYLNGGEHGVDDLVSRLADAPHSVAVEALEEAAEGATLAAVGDVVVRDAVITLDGSRSGPVLRSGTVEAERLFDITERVVPDPEGVVALQKGRTVLRRGKVELEADTLRIEDSCVRLSDQSPCSPESSRFFVGGRLQLPPPPKGSPDSPPTLQIRSETDERGVELVTTAPPAVPLVIPQVLIWAPLSQAAWLALSLLWLLAGALLFRRTWPAIDALVDSEIDRRDRAECRKARRRAALAHRAERLLDGIGVITATLSIALIVLSSQGEAPWDMYEELRPFATLGMYVALALGLGLVLLFSRLRTSEETRKTVGVLWDLTTFWPRAAHPLAPPCYAERVVPEICTRVHWALHYEDQNGVNLRWDNQVVLSGHSQGSAIVCAVLSRLPAEDLRRVRVITYGSQIRALYGRIFPAVFGPEQIGYEPTERATRLSDPFPDAPNGQPADGTASETFQPEYWSLRARFKRASGEWMNLFRRSDPLGYRVFSDYDREPDLYVREVPDVIIGDAGPRVNTHSGYQHTPCYRRTVARWTGEKVQADPVGTVDIPPLPT